jgi:transcriptional regulator with XRE-family HTH domain
MTNTPRRTARPVPEHWQLFFDQKGISSVAHLSRRTGIAGMTANRLVHGEARTSPDILRQVAQALDVEDVVIYGLAGWPTTTKPWEPPVEAEAMTDRQRKAVTEMIRSFVQPVLGDAKPDMEEECR